eukprot:8316826-Lingulodinium_polyedra.AAC.1
MWPSMTVAKLRSTVSGWSFPLYLANTRHHGEWVDAHFLHALGRASGVNLLVYQAHPDDVLVGA